jgi:glycosyltransferase involved in cell wall biosynthesis
LKIIKISIITVTKNCKDTIEDCLKSVRQQDYVNKQHIIIDGKSTDGTIEKIRELKDQVDYFSSEIDSGIYEALNKGLKIANGEIVGFLHADDIYATNSILTLIAKKFEDEKVCAVYGNLNYVDKKNTNIVIRKWKSEIYDEKKIKKGWMPPHPTLYVRREWYKKINGFNTKYKISADYLSILELFKHEEFKTEYIDEVLILMRTGGASNRSIKAVIKKMKEDWSILRINENNKINAFKVLVWKNLSKLRQYL